MTIEPVRPQSRVRPVLRRDSAAQDTATTPDTHISRTQPLPLGAELGMALAGWTQMFLTLKPRKRPPPADES